MSNEQSIAELEEALRQARQLAEQQSVKIHALEGAITRLHRQIEDMRRDALDLSNEIEWLRGPA